MTSFIEKDLKKLKQCSKCKMWSNLGFCWNCYPNKLIFNKNKIIKDVVK